MSARISCVFVTALLLAVALQEARAAPKTVCSITVNSSDELETFRRSLPRDKFQFVELVERGRPDWLASACRRGVHCDVLVISGHYDGRDEFYAESVSADEYLPVDEMERASCSSSCSGLFSQLKEVYLFGCNTLNPEVASSISTQIERSLAKSVSSSSYAERMSRASPEPRAESNRDRMRSIFKGVPVIYGFSAKAPVGPTAASMLGQHFRADGAAEVASGRVSRGLLGHFAGHSMAVTSGLTDADPRAAERQQVCRLAGDQLSPAQKLDFVHQLLKRDMAEVRSFLDRIERYATSLSDAERKSPQVARTLDEIAQDSEARNRYLDFVRSANPPAIRARLIKLAGNLGWLSKADEREELARMIGDILASRSVSAADVDLVCTLNQNRELDAELQQVHLSQAGQTDRLDHAAVLACLGDTTGRARTLSALTSSNADEVKIGQVYLRHRPIDNVEEVRTLTARIAGMRASQAQVLALDALAPLHLTDPESLEVLARLYAAADSAGVQAAVAGVLIRSDYGGIDTPQLVQILREHRLKSAAGEELIDALIRRLERHVL